MNKVFFTCLLALTIPMHGMQSAKELFTKSVQYKEMIKLYQLIAGAGDKPLSLPEFDPHVINTTLAIALNENLKDIVLFLCMYNQANPNHIIKPELFNIIKNNTDNYFNQSEKEYFSKLNDLANLDQPEGVPTYFLSQDIQLASACMHYGADLSLGYNIPTPYGTKQHGNILTFSIDNKQYPAALVKYYLQEGAGTFIKSYASNGGCIVHHILYAISISNGQDIQKLFECATYLLEAAPKLLHVKDRNGNTPSGYLENMKHNIDKDTAKLLAQLFELHSAAIEIKRSNE